MRATASAPGKAFVLGEYAVLDGAPALVAALDRRAVATVSTSARWSVSAQFGTRRLTADIDPCSDAAMRWPDRVPDGTREALRLVRGVLETLAPELTGPDRPAAAVHVDTSSFFDGDAKLGMGSSAAATVALAGALFAWAGRPAPQLARLVALHRAFQGGRGSGADTAAALHGGLIRVQASEPSGAPVAESMDWPESVSAAWFWTGRSADTRHYLDILSAWRERDPHGATAAMGRLCHLARQPWSDGAELVALAGRYATALGDLDTASGLDIYAGAHATLRTLAGLFPVAYKPCGAGGGDLGVALATDPGALSSFTTKAARAGIPALPLRVDPAGLRVRVDARHDGG